MKDIVVSEIDEDLLCSDYCNSTNILGVGGHLGVGYLIKLTPKSAVVIDLDGPDEGKNESWGIEKDGILTLNGHFKTIS